MAPARPSFGQFTQHFFSGRIVSRQGRRARQAVSEISPRQLNLPSRLLRPWRERFAFGHPSVIQPHSSIRSHLIILDGFTPASFGAIQMASQHCLISLRSLGTALMLKSSGSPESMASGAGPAIPPFRPRFDGIEPA